MNYSKVSYSPNLKNLWIKKWIKIEDNLQPLQQLVLNSLTIGVTCIRFELQYRTLFCILDLLLYPSQTPSFRLSSGVLENIFIHKLWTKCTYLVLKSPYMTISSSHFRNVYLFNSPFKQQPLLPITLLHHHSILSVVGMKFWSYSLIREPLPFANESQSFHFLLTISTSEET